MSIKYSQRRRNIYRIDINPKTNSFDVIGNYKNLQKGKKYICRLTTNNKEVNCKLSHDLLSPESSSK